MTRRSLPPREQFVQLVEAVDPDAAYRMTLLNEAAPFLFEGRAPGEREGHALADRFERWRYQLLNKRDGILTPPARDLADTLDLASCRLKGLTHPPRAPRAALAAGDPAAEAMLDPAIPLEAALHQAAQVTAQHFGADPPGHRILLYAPIYLSSFCINHCLYCGFRYPSEIERRHLTPEEAIAQADLLGRRGFRHLLLVAGDFPRLTSPDYLEEMVSVIAARGYTVAVEVAPQTTAAYARLASVGATGVTLYQETYEQDVYAANHPLGTKVWYDWRLEGPERAAEAGMTRLGLGILLGLADPALDLRALIGHGRYLRERFPHVRLAFSLPRIHEAPAGFELRHAVADDAFQRMYCALRLAFPDTELVLSTREAADLRDRLASICITQMSAGSSTSPGGYADGDDTGCGVQNGVRDGVRDGSGRQQFPVCDHRPADEVARRLTELGQSPVWELPVLEPRL